MADTYSWLYSIMTSLLFFTLRQLVLHVMKNNYIISYTSVRFKKKWSSIITPVKMGGGVWTPPWRPRMTIKLRILVDLQLKVQILSPSQKSISPLPPGKSWQGARFFKLLLLFVIGTWPITYSFSVELNKKYMYTNTDKK